MVAGKVYTDCFPDVLHEAVRYGITASGVLNNGRFPNISNLSQIVQVARHCRIAQIQADRNLLPRSLFVIPQIAVYLLSVGSLDLSGRRYILFFHIQFF